MNAAAGGEVPIDLGEAAIRPIAEARAAAAVLELPWWTITPFATADSGKPVVSPHDFDQADVGDGDAAPFPISAEPAPGYRGDTSRALTDIRQWLTDDWRVVLVTEGHGPARRLAELLRGEGLGARDGDLTAPPEAGLAHVATGLLESGFVWPAIRLVVLAEADLAGTRSGTRQSHRMPSRRRGGIDPLQLTPGDFIVHEQHGVGR